MVEKEPGHIPRKDRHKVDVAATAVRLNGTSLPVRVSDMSPEGCRVALDGDLPIAEWLLLNVPGLAPIKAQVRWSFSGQAGLQFSDSIS